MVMHSGWCRLRLRWLRQAAHSTRRRDRELLMPAIILRSHLAVGPQVFAAVGVGVTRSHVVRGIDWNSAVVHLRAVLHLQRVVTVLGARVNDGAAVGRP